MWNYYTITETFFQLNGTLAINFLPSNILEYFFLFEISETMVNPLNVLCSSIPPFSYIVDQYFNSGATNSPLKVPPSL